MIPPFEAASAIRPTGPGTFEGTVPDGWQQGRGAFGGLVYGMLARAMEQVVNEPARRLRTFTGGGQWCRHAVERAARPLRASP